MKIETALVAAACFLGLAGCGGGGGEPTPPPPASISFSADQIAFTTPGPWAVAARPTTQRLAATVQGTVNGTLTILVQVNNPELVSVGNVSMTGPNSGEATVTAANPATLPIGSHTGSIVVRACVNDPQCNSNHLQGSPKTIAISYDIPTNVEGDSVSPRVVAANAPGTVILRGRGFPSGATIAFGAGGATSVDVVGSSEIRAAYPALAPGNYSVTINSGAVAFSGALTVVPHTNYAAVFLPHPTPDGAFVLSLRYDEERRAILAVVMPPAGTTESKLIRYAYDGASWTLSTSVDVPGLQQVRIAPDGSRLLVLRARETPLETFIDERDPVTLDAGASTALTGDVVLASSFALTNDGNALVSVWAPGSGFNRQYLYAVSRRQFVRLDQTASPSFTVASLDGSRALLLGSYLYEAGTGRLRQVINSGLAAFHQAEASASVTGSRIQSGGGVYDGELNLLGYAPGSHAAAVINGAGTRLYSVFPGDTNNPTPQLYAYDIDAPTSGGSQFPQLLQVAGPIPLPDDPGMSSSPAPEMAISSDGRTVFIGGFRGIVVMPVP